MARSGEGGIYGRGGLHFGAECLCCKVCESVMCVYTATDDLAFVVLFSVSLLSLCNYFPSVVSPSASVTHEACRFWSICCVECAHVHHLRADFTGLVLMSHFILL